jgi:hypothetical protein
VHARSLSESGFGALDLAVLASASGQPLPQDPPPGLRVPLLSRTWALLPTAPRDLTDAVGVLARLPQRPSLWTLFDDPAADGSGRTWRRTVMRSLVMIHGPCHEHKDADELQGQWLDALRRGCGATDRLAVVRGRHHFPYYGRPVGLVNGQPGEAASRSSRAS